MQYSTAIFAFILLILVTFFLRLNAKYGLLKDASTASKKPYSYARVQLAWWTVIILASFIAIFITKGNLPILDNSLIVLLGISSATTATAALIDSSDQNKPNAVLIQNQESEGFFLDILSDSNGVSIHRLQAMLFNIIIGIWLIYSVAAGLKICINVSCINTILPSIDANKLLLLGVSAATYAGLKTNENK